ncbi:hypothetical protein HanRHA438_Chr16g0757961 [Helianthus annuus]|nr:hypothetical protein HanRHA438_Chr16g0757961 [Helianthus annuus]
MRLSSITISMSLRDLVPLVELLSKAATSASSSLPKPDIYHPRENNHLPRDQCFSLRDHDRHKLCNRREVIILIT